MVLQKLSDWYKGGITEVCHVTKQDDTNTCVM